MLTPGQWSGAGRRAPPTSGRWGGGGPAPRAAAAGPHQPQGVGVGGGQHAVGQLTVLEGARQLQGAYEQSHQTDGPLLRGRGVVVTVIEVSGDGGDDRADAGGVGLPNGTVAAADLVEECRGRATGGWVVAVSGRDVVADERLHP